MAEAVARGRIQAPGFFADPAVRKAYTDCAWNGPARTNLNPAGGDGGHQAGGGLLQHGAGGRRPK